MADAHVQRFFSRWPGARWLAAPCLLLLTAVCYWGTLDAFFVQDDYRCLAVAGQPMPSLEMFHGVCFFRPLSTYWLPLLNLSVWGLQPFWHHATYLLLFLATVGALFYWLRGLTGSTPAALAGAALYAFSKTHLYTLAWIAGGIDVSAALFLVLGLWAADVYLKQSDAGDGRSGRRLLWIIGITFACGLMCKESCAVFAPACLAWIAARKFIARRPFAPAEWKLVVVLIAILAVYLPIWKLSYTVADESAGRLQFNLSRGEWVLEDSVIAVVPAAEKDLPRSLWWLLPAPVLAAIAAASRRKTARPFGYVALGLSLWVLPAAIFAFTKYPWILQLYYAHFSVIGLAILAALAVQSLQSRLDAWRGLEGRARPTAAALRGWAVAVLAIAVFGVWIGLAGRTIRAGIRDRASPALYMADISRNAFETLQPHLQNAQYRRVVFLDLSETMWWSIYFGKMVSVFFPEVDTACDGRDGFEAPKQMRTTPTTLVVRQTGEKDLTIVR